MKQNRLKRTLGDVAFSTFFSLPSVLLYIVFMILPLIFVIYLSFTQWTGAGDINGSVKIIAQNYLQAPAE